MRKYENFDKVEAYTGEYEKLEPGGYVCKILQVKVEEKNYGHLMRIAFDIAEGEHKDYYKRLFDRTKQNGSNEVKWRGMYYQTVKEDSLQYFKGFITAIENSNLGYKWNWDEKTLVGKLFGGVFGEEEYKGADGKIKLGVKCMQVRSVDKIRNGEYTIPSVKKLSASADSGYTVVADEDSELPF